MLECRDFGGYRREADEVEGGTPDQYLFGVSPEGIGFLFMWVSAGLGIVTALATDAPPKDIQDLVEDIRVPGTRQPHGIADAGMAPAPAE